MICGSFSRFIEIFSKFEIFLEWNYFYTSTRHVFRAFWPSSVVRRSQIFDGSQRTFPNGGARSWTGVPCLSGRCVTARLSCGHLYAWFLGMSRLFLAWICSCIHQMALLWQTLRCNLRCESYVRTWDSGPSWNYDSFAFTRWRPGLTMVTIAMILNLWALGAVPSSGQAS